MTSNIFQPPLSENLDPVMFEVIAISVTSVNTFVCLFFLNLV